MTDGNNNTETTASYAELIARRAEIDTKLVEIDTIAVPAMRERWVQEAAQIGKTVEEVLGLNSKKRGRKPRAKHEE